MSGGFLRQVLDGSSISVVDCDCMGYSGDELSKIARLYDIKVQGQIESFLGEMGRSDGGLIGDYMIHLYRPTWRVRQHLAFQFGFIDQMQDGGFFDFLKKPFVFSIISETQYYFMQTILGDRVYHYDSNAEIVKDTEWDLVGFLKILAEENRGKLVLRTVGNLLEI